MPGWALPIELKVQPPKDALALFESKGLLVTGSWQSIWQAEHARAFTVANLARMDLLEEIHAALTTALLEGQDYRTFAKGLVPKLQAAGWWNQPVPNGKPLGPQRLQLIYDANLRTSYAAAKWARIQRLKKRRPFLRYNTMGDARVRPAHRAWEGITRPVDDPFWDTHFPPNGWRCRCTVEQLSQTEMDAEGIEVTPDSALPTGSTTFTNRLTGEVTTVPTGIDPGWAYNPGKAAQPALLAQARQKLEAALPEVGQVGVKGLVDSPAFEAWLQQPEGNFPVLRLAPELQQAIQASEAVGVLSPETMAEQAKAHPELELADYRRLPGLGALPDLVIQDGENTLVLVQGEGGLWLAALKAARGGERETFVTSFRRTTAADVARKLRSGTVLFEREGWRG